MVDLLERLTSALADRYAVESEIGRGGMATVFLAEDLRHKRQVAVKVMHPELAASVGTDRFLREIETVAGLTHPHVLPLHDSGDADGLLFYVMPYVEGESLGERLEREGQLSVEQALSIAADVADALAYAHRQGVIHRDIKPGNILLAEGHARIADFGVARAVGVASEGEATATGLAVGTPKYMSPEQAAGGEVDGRSDVYALGCVLYEMLAGDPPFDGPTPQVILTRKASETVPGLRVRRKAVPADLEAVIAKAMATAPVDRFANAEEFAEALEAPEASGRAARQHRVMRQLAGAGVAIVLIVAGIWLAGLRTTEEEAGESQAVELDPDAIAVLPFQVVGTSEVLKSFGRDIPTLFWMKVTGAYGPRAVHPADVLVLWDAAGATVETPLTEARALDIAQAVGAGQLVHGVVAGGETDMSLTATLLEVPTGELRVRRLSVEGSYEEYMDLADALINQLLATDRGWDIDLPQLTDHVPEAVQAYMRGVETGARGDFTGAGELFDEALSKDSTLVLAAVMKYHFGERDQAAARFAWKHQDQLSSRDRAAVRAQMGWRFGATSTVAQRVAQWDSVGVSDWETDVHTTLLHHGRLADIPYWLEREKALLEHGVQLGWDGSFAYPNLFEIAAVEGDTTAMRRYAEEAMRSASSPISRVRTGAVRLRLAYLQDDTAAAESVWHEIEIAADSALRYLDPLLGLLLDGRGLAGLDRFMLSEHEAQPGARRNRWTGLAWARARGRYRDWSEIRDLRYDGADPLRMPVLNIRDVLFLQEPEDSTALAAASWLDSVATGTIIVPPTSNDPTPDTRAPAMARCWSTLWKIAHGDTEGATEAIRYLREEVPLPYRYSVCAGLIEVMASEHGGGDSRSAVVRLDSIVRPVPMEGPGWPLDRDATGYIDNLLLSRWLPQVGDTAAALAAARRAKPWHSFQTEFMQGIFVDLLREEARLTAMVGDTAAAIEAYEHYFNLRDTRPDHPPWAAQWDSMRVEYGALTGVEVQ